MRQFIASFVSMFIVCGLAVAGGLYALTLIVTSVSFSWLAVVIVGGILAVPASFMVFEHFE